MSEVSVKGLKSPLGQYIVITGNYWAFTLTDGALRMLVVLHFHQLGYSPFEIAMLFLFYEVFGVITNLIGGWLGARIGLNRTMNLGLSLQVIALGMLLAPTVYLTVPLVMGAQALSGIAKDLNKMSAKSAIKTLVPANADNALYRWVALLTGSKNALKGIGFFMGGVLLALAGFQGAILIMLIMLVVVFILSLFFLKEDLGIAKNKPKFREIFSKSRAINTLSAARLFLFGSRDVWFVVALPVYFSAQLNWDHSTVGTFFAVWVIGYGFIQTLAPALTGTKKGENPNGNTALSLVIPLAITPAIISLLLINGWHIEETLVAGLLVFGALFALNSSVHSFLIVSYAKSDGVSMDVGFYYMANAMGRLVGTVLSGWVYQNWGLEMCLFISTGFLILTAGISLALTDKTTAN
ncbi:organoarsenical effux MFS transporter ArsJ [Sneathiella limimaris]|uniref:organoarsenical effux MFS transporter ArsJ n=1 Tax=Sneathiella limimaris TaxID=1964213 RepID=UPI00146A8BE8|nr:organoarsenical effux MFS transporter ArsJ [Sneathiella limimaris]